MMSFMRPRRVAGIAAICTGLVLGLSAYWTFSRYVWVSTLSFESTSDSEKIAQVFTAYQNQLRIDIYDSKKGGLMASSLKLADHQIFGLNWSSKTAQLQPPEYQADGGTAWTKKKVTPALPCEFAECVDIEWSNSMNPRTIVTRLAHDANQIDPVWIENQNESASGWMAQLAKDYPAHLIVKMSVYSDGSPERKLLQETKLIHIGHALHALGSFSIPKDFKVDRHMSLQQLPPGIREQMIKKKGAEILEARPQENSVTASPKNGKTVSAQPEKTTVIAIPKSSSGKQP